MACFDCQCLFRVHNMDKLQQVKMSAGLTISISRPSLWWTNIYTYTEEKICCYFSSIATMLNREGHHRWLCSWCNSRLQSCPDSEVPHPSHPRCWCTWTVPDPARCFPPAQTDDPTGDDATYLEHEEILVSDALKVLQIHRWSWIFLHALLMSQIVNSAAWSLDFECQVICPEDL